MSSHSRSSVQRSDQSVDSAGASAPLSTKALRGGAFKVLAQWTQAVVGIGSAMVLARLLTPEDFGLMAMVVSLTGLVGSLNNFGLPMAAVHRETVTYGEMSALFWLNMKLSLGMGLFLCAMAPALAWFYGEPSLTAMTLATAVGVFILSIAAQHEAFLTRQMRFGLLSTIDVTTLLVGVTTGIVAALSGLGYWSLVLQTVAMSLVRGAAVVWASGWRPSLVGSLGAVQRDGVRAMTTYGFEYTGSKLLNHVSRNLDRVLVGYFSGPTAAGLYDNAYRWSLFPIRQLYKPLKAVAVSGLSRVQDRPETFRAYFRSAVRLVLSASMPAIAFVFAETRDVVLFLLGDQWLGAVPLLKVLCVNAFFRAMGKITPWLYLAQGGTARQFRWSLIHAPVLIVAVAGGVYWGPLGVAVGFTVATALLTVPEIAYCLRTSYVTGRDLVRTLWRPAVATVAAVFVVIGIDASLYGDFYFFVDFFAELSLFCLAYVGTWVGLPGGWSALVDTFQLAKQLRKKDDGSFPLPRRPVDQVNNGSSEHVRVPGRGAETQTRSGRPRQDQ